MALKCRALCGPRVVFRERPTRAVSDGRKTRALDCLQYVLRVCTTWCGSRHTQALPHWGYLSAHSHQGERGTSLACAVAGAPSRLVRLRDRRVCCPSRYQRPPALMCPWRRGPLAATLPSFINSVRTAITQRSGRPRVASPRRRSVGSHAESPSPPSRN